MSHDRGDNSVTNLINRAFMVCIFLSSLIPGVFPGSSPLRLVPFGFFSALFSLWFVRGLRRIPPIEFAKQFAGLWPQFILVVLIVAAQLLSAFHSTTTSQTIVAGGCAVTLLFLHFIIPVPWSRDQEFLFDAAAWTVLCVLAVSLLLFSASAVMGGSLGITRPSDLLLEKRALMENLGLPFIERGVLLEPNWLGALTTIAVPLLLYRRRVPTVRFPKSFTIPALGLCVITLILTFDIIALISAIATSAFFLLGQRVWIRRFGIAVSTILVVFFLALPVANMDIGFMSRLPVTSPGRVLLWSQASDLIHHHPISGIGQEQIVKVLPYHLSAHNSILDIGLAYGIIPMMLFGLYLILTMFRLSVREKSDANLAVQGLFFNFIFMMTFETYKFGGLTGISFLTLAIVIPAFLRRYPDNMAGGREGRISQGK